MIRTTNFSRALCLVLVLVLCLTSVLRPVTVYATGAEAATMAGFVGIAPEVAIPIILTLLGIAYIGSHWNQICDFADSAISSLVTEIDEELYIAGYEYNGNTYIEHSVVDAVASAVNEYNTAIFDEAWELGKEFTYMYTFKLVNGNRDAVLWTNDDVQISDTGTYINFSCTGDFVTYYANKEGTNPYNNVYDSRTDDYTVDPALSFAKEIYGDYSISTTTAIADPSITYGETIAVTNPVTEEEEIAIPISPSISVPATKTEEEVVVTPVPGEGTADLSGILSWLKAIWDAIKSLASNIANPIVKVITAVKTGVVSLVEFFTGTTTVESPLDALHFSTLFDLFPFNIPYGIYQAIAFWEAEAAAPIIKIPLPTYAEGAMDVYEFEINFSEIPGMDALAATIRAGELILFAVGLLMITRKVTKW